MRRALVFALSLFAAMSAAAQEVRAVDGDYYRRMAEREKASKLQSVRYAVSLSRIEALPMQPTEGHTVRLKGGVITGAVPEGHCADGPSTSLTREGARIKVSVPAVPCANPLAASANGFELIVGRLPPGDYTVELEVPNDAGVAPAKSLPLKVRAIASDMDRLIVAVEESPADVAKALATQKYDVDSLEAALNHACQWEDNARTDKAGIARVLATAGAKPASALHGAAHGSTQCLRALLALGADPNQDIASLPGVRLGTGKDALRFKPAPWGTPLYFAVHSRKAENIRILLDAGADPNKGFGGGHSAYAESHLIGNDAGALAIQRSLQERGGSLTLVQRAKMAGGTVGGAAVGAVFLAICQVAAWTNSSCMH
ncbi:hypothetical protein [Ramlibacter sp. PS4R-6]|uniref:hypothetical protein n=1 Tax=Ramlibacter sp. PS4R-6 TaxID=3133438 RepID=UPI0030AD2DC7